MNTDPLYRGISDHSIAYKFEKTNVLKVARALVGRSATLERLIGLIGN